MSAGKSRKRKGRRARGTGSIFYSDRLGKWVGRAVVGRSATGRTLYVERQGDTQAEVVVKLAAAKPPGPNTTVGEWAARWLGSIKVRPRTLATYTAAVRDYVTPSIGHVKLTALTAGDVERAAAGWVGGADPLKGSTARLYLGTLSTCLNAAVRSGLVAGNPVAVAKKPRAAKKKIDPYTPGQLAAVVAAAADRPAAHCVALLAATGCRIGEACALDVEDLDRAAGTVAITKTYLPGFGGIGPPKSPHSVRTIRVPVAALPAVLAAAAGRKSGPLFLTTSGERRSPRLAAFAWETLARAAGVPAKNPHQLRHSVATAMIGAGVPLGDVAAYLGDTVDTIVKVYVHRSGADPSRAMDRIFGGGKVGEEWAVGTKAAGSA